jgi:Undecaprenyl-phosphate galactose phosphotransferase WbaP
LAACCAIAIGLIAMRHIVRRFGPVFRWWGYPVAVLGDGDAALSTLRKLKNEPYLGLRPVALVGEHAPTGHLDGITVCRLRHLDKISASRVKHAVVAAPELSQTQFADLMERASAAFPNVILIPDSHFPWKTGAHTRGVASGVLGLQVRNNLLCPGPRITKRVIDLAICIMAAPLAVPVIAALALAVAVETGAPCFYSQDRVGHNGRAFRIWKFRTMVRNSSEVLARALESTPALQKEWAESQKLRNDPRTTRVGRLLRKTSLDELPQLWNVIKGEMSLVGPRPIVSEEIAKYKNSYSTYRATTPGMTGLWQVSGRNRTTYAERIAYDTYYVRNWSVWMDIYLLAKTVGVVLTGYGAY